MAGDPTTETLPLRRPVFHILLALSQNELHGLGIADIVSRDTDGSVDLGPGTLYRSLKEMTERGLVREVEAPEGADPRRKYYGATELGRSMVAAEATRLASVVRLARARDVLPDGA